MSGLNLKVAHQGLIIILIPLACELVALGMILYLLDQSNNAIKQEAVSKQIMEEANSLNKILYDGGEAMVQYFYTRDMTELAKFRNRADTMQRTFDKLEKLSKGNYERLERIYLLKRNSEKMMDIIFAQGLPKGPDDPAGKPGNIKRFRDRITNIYGPLLATIEEIVAEERQSLEKRVQEGREYAEKLKTVVMFAIAFSIAISIWLSLYFSRRITYRLGVVHGNLERFLKRQPLAAKVVGKDEIADLDRAFHDMTGTLERLEKSKQEFVSMISHDIRSPLTAVQGTLAVAAEGKFGKLDESGVKRLAGAERNIDTVMRLINDLLTIDKIDSGSLKLDYQPCELESLVDDAIATVTPLAEKRRIELANLCKPIELDCDAGRIEQVLVNLLSNAIKFSPEKERITVSSASDEETVTVRISDRGRGIPEGLREKIFDRFQQIEPGDDTDETGQVQGFGLGLAICRGIIDAHRGSIGVAPADSEASETEPGTGSKTGITTGSTFWFTLPRFSE